MNEYLKFIELKWKCSSYRGCHKEIENGEKMIVCFSKENVFEEQRIATYHEKCFLELENDLENLAVPVKIKDIYKKLHIYTREDYQ